MASLVQHIFDNSWLNGKRSNDKASGKYPIGRIVVFGKHLKTPYRSYFGKDLQSWQYEQLSQEPKALACMHSTLGPAWIISLKYAKKHLLQDSLYAISRNLCGKAIAGLRDIQLNKLQLDFVGCQDDAVLGALIGLELAAYRFKPSKKSLPQLQLLRDGSTLNAELKKQARHMAQAVNISRHLVNLPADQLNPQSYGQTVKRLFSKSSLVQVNHWPAKQLEREGMGLLAAVGKSAAHEPCLVHLRYRPGKASKLQPIAFVGKGITFDSGGLDIKPGPGMRLMKKRHGWFC